MARPQGPDAEAAFPVINPPLLVIFRYGMLGLFPGEPAAAVYPRSLHIHYLPINCLSSLSSEAAPARYKKAEQPARVPSKELAVLALAMASCPRCVNHHSPATANPQLTLNTTRTAEAAASSLISHNPAATARDGTGPRRLYQTSDRSRLAVLLDRADWRA